MVRNWAGNVTFSSDVLHRPTRIDELQKLVAGGPQVHALGTGHSFSRVADTTGVLISVADLDGEIVIDPLTRTVEVPAGATFATLTAALERDGWALHNLGSLPHISLAGACATGTHGSGDTNRCLAAAAVAIEFVRADGELVRVTRDDPSFGGCVVALGALGVTTRITLAIEPSYLVRQDVWLDAPIDTVVGRFADVMAAGYSVSIFTRFAPDADVLDAIWVKSRADATVADGREWGARPAEAAQHPVAGVDAAAATEQLGSPGPWHERLPHFRVEFTPSIGYERQSEYLLPREHGAAALEALREVRFGPVLEVCEVRTVAADDLWLSPCSGRDTVALHFTWRDDDELVGPAIAAVEAALDPFDPRPHWGKLFGLDPERVRAGVPMLGRFRELAARHDPERRFGNEFLQRYVY